VAVGIGGMGVGVTFGVGAVVSLGVGRKEVTDVASGLS